MGLDAEITVSTNTFVGQSSQVSLIQRTLWLLNTLYNQILAIFSVLLIWIFFENNELNNQFFWHLFLSTAAYVPLMAAAIILFSEDNLVTQYIPRTKRYWIHGYLLIVSCLAVSVGIIVEINSKEKVKREHFKSDHAILGLVSWVLVFVSVVTGCLAANTGTFSKVIRPVVAKFIHNFLGIAGFAIGMGSLYTELRVLSRYTSEHVFNASKWALWYITAWSLLAAFKSLWGQLRSIFS